MSYHDGYINPGMSGISVVNPLHRIERKLKRIQAALDSVNDSSTLTAVDLKIKIQSIIDNDDKK
jgi:hypothetical protein